jgi:hypothetical protein
MEKKDLLVKERDIPQSPVTVSYFNILNYVLGTF